MNSINVFQQPQAIPGMPADFECYYDVASKEFLVLNHNLTHWIPVSERALERILAGKGVSRNRNDATGNSPVHDLVMAIKLGWHICYDAGLAGHPRGFRIVGGKQILVTEDAPIVDAPTKGDWSLIKAFIEGLFKDCPEQIPYIYGWLKTMLESLKRPEHRRPGQVLFIAGPRGCGKSFLQKIITRLFGGRSEKPYEYMTGATPFNKHCFRAEHLIIEDEVPSDDFRVRKTFGANCKKIAVNDLQVCYGKFQDAITLDPIQRMTASVNSSPESLAVIPMLDDESLEDKVMLLKAFEFEYPMPIDTAEGWRAFETAIYAQCPAFKYHLLEEFEIPADIKSPRYGVKYYHNKALLRAIESIAPQASVLNLIDTSGYLSENVPYIQSSAMEWERKLRDNPRTSARASLLFRHSNSCATYLGLLAKRFPHRVEKIQLSGNRCEFKVLVAPDLDMIIDPPRKDHDLSA